MYVLPSYITVWLTYDYEKYSKGLKVRLLSVVSHCFLYWQLQSVCMRERGCCLCASLAPSLTVLLTTRNSLTGVSSRAAPLLWAAAEILWSLVWPNRRTAPCSLRPTKPSARLMEQYYNKVKCAGIKYDNNRLLILMHDIIFCLLW